MKKSGRDTPRVLVPPPLLYAVPLAIGLAFHFAFPARFLPAGWVQLALGLPLVAVAVVLYATAIGTLRKAATDFRFAKPTTAIVTRGPFRLSRNPIYLANTLVFLGTALATNALWALVLLPLAVALVTVGAIYPEERYLKERFGQEYLDYKARVRRWL